jgi:hypothetical protein
MKRVNLGPRVRAKADVESESWTSSSGALWKKPRRFEPKHRPTGLAAISDRSIHFLDAPKPDRRENGIVEQRCARPVSNRN